MYKDGEVWMMRKNESVSRCLACQIMDSLGVDFINDFMTRDEIICAIDPIVTRICDEKQKRLAEVAKCQED